MELSIEYVPSSFRENCSPSLRHNAEQGGRANDPAGSWLAVVLSGAVLIDFRGGLAAHHWMLAKARCAPSVAVPFDSRIAFAARVFKADFQCEHRNCAYDIVIVPRQRPAKPTPWVASAENHEALDLNTFHLGRG